MSFAPRCGMAALRRANSEYYHLDSGFAADRDTVYWIELLPARAQYRDSRPE